MLTSTEEHYTGLVLLQVFLNLQKNNLLVFAPEYAATWSFFYTQMRQKLIKCCPVRLNTQ